MKVGVLCEFSGVVRDAFLSRGHDAISCDLLPTETPGPHIQADCLTVDWSGYDLLICHPPCTYLARSGARWWPGRQQEQAAAVEFVRGLMALPVARIAVENPVGHLSTAIRKPDQVLQPWQFGHGEVKATCLWLKGLPILLPMTNEPERAARVHRTVPSPDRWKIRSRTLPGIAEAMAAQWGEVADHSPRWPETENLQLAMFEGAAG